MAHEDCPLERGWRCPDHKDHAVMIGVSRWIARTIIALMLTILAGIGGMYVRMGAMEQTLAVTVEVSRRNAELIRDLRTEIRAKGLHGQPYTIQ